MIPNFPIFKNLEISDRAEIYKLTQDLPPYSDVNFVSLWSWNILGATQISVLNESLIVCMPDYLTQKPCYFFYGYKNLSKSALIIGDFCKKQPLFNWIFSIPDDNISEMKFLNRIVVEDKSNHDYILSTDQLAEMKGNRWRGKRGHVNRFKRLYAGRYQVEKIEFSSQSVCDDMRKIFSDWDEKKRRENIFFEHESRAFERLLADADKFDIIALGIKIDGQLEGFTIFDFESNSTDYVTIHFEKGNTEIEGIYTVLNYAVAQVAKKIGRKFINYEQDLGIVGLEAAKKMYFPVKLLKKYTIIKPKLWFVVGRALENWLNLFFKRIFYARTTK